MIKQTSAKRCTVYALSSSAQPGVVRYIGQTAMPLRRRLNDHLSAAARYAKRPVTCWIRKHRAAGSEIVIKPLCIGEWNVAEVDCIAAARAAGLDLLNVTAGGDGGATCTGKRWTEAEKDKLRKPRAPEVVARVSAALRGRKLSPEHRAKTRLAALGNTPWNKGMTMPEEHRAKLREGNKGRVRPNGITHSPESRDRMAVSHAGKKASEATKLKMAESAKTGWEKRRAKA